jgi:ribosomal protein L7Ae-like RNA K-turn-binding protein
VVTDGAPEDNSIVTVLGKASNNSVKALHIVIAADVEEAQNLALFTGKATSGVSVENAFDMITDDNNNVVTPQTALVITLADDAGIFDEYGMPVVAENIVNGSDVDVFGLAIPDLSTVSGVKAAFVIVDNDVEPEKTSGLIAAINNLKTEITVMVVSELFSGDVCVDITAAKLFLLDIVDQNVSSNEITVNELQPGMSVDVYSDKPDSACLLANVVLASDN